MFELERLVEERIARLETSIEQLDEKLTTKIDDLKDSFANYRIYVEKSFAERISRTLDRVSWLIVFATLLAVIALGFKWV